CSREALMISLSGSPVRCCEGVTRREWLSIGGLSALGLSLPELFRARVAQGAFSSGALAPCFGRAKSCIVMFLFGAPAHQDTWDMKPEAPGEVRGEFRPISTTVPG